MLSEISNLPFGGPCTHEAWRNLYLRVFFDDLLQFLLFQVLCHVLSQLKDDLCTWEEVRIIILNNTINDRLSYFATKCIKALKERVRVVLNDWMREGSLPRPMSSMESSWWMVKEPPALDDHT